MNLQLTDEQAQVVAVAVEMAIDTLDMDNMQGLVLLKEVQAMLPEVTGDIIV